jgi:phenol hydroxylase P1 protein
MGYELRTNTIEPRRHTFDPLVERFGDKAASRYQEGTFGMQATENFHYRPFWAPQHDLYDPDYTALKLTDPYSYTDPRQYYYATYVANRAEDYDAFARTLKYAEQRNLLDGLPEAWLDLVKSCFLPLRHYEAGAEMVAINGCRFAWGTSISQALSYSAFDRIGNAQVTRPSSTGWRPSTCSRCASTSSSPSLKRTTPQAWSPSTWSTPRSSR